MGRVDCSVREPTGRAWLALALGVVPAGEFLRDGETAVAAPFVALAVLALAWLVSLHVWPGRLELDVELGTLVRTRRPFVRTRRLEAPLAAWTVYLDFYDERARERGRFRRLQLAHAQSHQVILWNDIARGADELALGLASVSTRLAAYEARVEVTSASG